MDLPLTKVARGAQNRAEALRLQYLEHPDVGAGRNLWAEQAYSIMLRTS